MQLEALIPFFSPCGPNFFALEEVKQQKKLWEKYFFFIYFYFFGGVTLFFSMGSTQSLFVAEINMVLKAKDN